MAWLAALGLVVAACGPDPDAPTFSRDVAPILYANCVTCHRPGDVAPFSLLDYEGAARRARQIAEVTRSRYMPPWLPEPGYVELAGERRLTEAEIATLGRWAEAGAPRGDPEVAPTPPPAAVGWRFGEPDLVLELAEPFTVPAEGRDVFRNFVLPIPVERRRWVEAVEFRPGNPRVVHHAVLQVDRTDWARRRDLGDPGPGFGGMSMGASERPDGHFLGWTPGKQPAPPRPGMAWGAAPGMDMVVQLHMPTTGKPEPVQPRIGLHFTNEAPTVDTFGIQLGTEAIDIPPGATDYRIHDAFTLPVAVEAIGVYPHAHYLGKRMEAWARLPDGSRQGLLLIEDWDFDWQDDYRYRQPVPLPAGSVVEMEFTYDNSPSNPQNPHVPPERVTFGFESTDEMGYLLLQVVVAGEEELLRLQEAQLAKTLERAPDVWEAHLSLADLLVRRGEVAEALEHYREARRLRPDEARIEAGLGRTLGMSGRMAAGLRHLERAVELDPQLVSARNDLGVAYRLAGRLAEAAVQLETALALDPASLEARANLAQVELARGHRERAAELIREALDAPSLEARPGLEARLRQLLGHLGR